MENNLTSVSYTHLMCIRDRGRTVKQFGWRALDAAYRASMKNAEPDKETEDKACLLYTSRCV